MAKEEKGIPDASALKALDILEVLAGEPAGLSLTRIAEDSGLSKSTCHRFLKAMAARHYVIRNDRAKRYQIGHRVMQLTSGFLDSLHIREVARPYLEELGEVTGETVHLVQLDDTSGVYIDKVNTKHAVGLLSRLGKQMPLHATSCGKVILAWQSTGYRERVIREKGLSVRTETTITSPERLWAELEQVHARGYALDNGENREGVICVAAPVFDATGMCTTSISVGAPSYRFSLEQAEAMAPVVVAAAAAISRDLGYHGAPAYSIGTLTR